jgi:hypothetical protein
MVADLSGFVVRLDPVTARAEVLPAGVAGLQLQLAVQVAQQVGRALHLGGQAVRQPDLGLGEGLQLASRPLSSVRSAHR